MSTENLTLLVEFKLWLAGTVEEHLIRQLGAAARLQGRRLPLVARNCLRAGALAAVARLDAERLEAFTVGSNWHGALAHADATGAWGRILDETLRQAFPPGPA